MTAEELTAYVRAGVPLAGALGVEVLSAGDGAATVRLPPSALSLRPGGTASGPSLMALADVALWAALLGSNGGRDDARTTDLAVAFLRPAGAAGVLAEARWVRRGRRALYGEVWMRGAGAEEPCAHATSAWLSVV